MICCAILACIISLPIGWLLAMGAGVDKNNGGALAWCLHNSSHLMDAPKAKSQTQFSFAARVKSIVCAWRGIVHVARHEHNAWIHIAGAIVLIVLGLTLQLTADDWRWILLAILLVWAAETFNTAIEVACDAVSQEYRQNIQVAKDVAAGAVLLTAVLAVVIGVLTVTPYLTTLKGWTHTQTKICTAHHANSRSRADVNTPQRASESWFFRGVEQASRPTRSAYGSLAQQKAQVC